MTIRHIFQALACLAANSAVSAALVERDASTCTTVRDRVPWSALTSEEKSSYINADLCLINSPAKAGIPGAVTRWDDLQWPHVVQTATVHGVGAFLPFHRYYLTVHERLIKDECGYTGRMPYWDELHDIGKMTASELWEDEYFGGNGAGPDSCVESGPFNNLTLRWVQDGSVEEHCLSRQFDGSYLEFTNQTEIDACNAIQSYTDAWLCWFGGPHGSSGPHASGHAAVGGSMADATLSPGDPVFYLHHAWLDKLWWEWQKQDLSNRLTDMGGPNLPIAGSVLGGQGPEFTNYFGDNGNVTTLNHRLFMSELYPNITIRDIMDLNADVACSEYINIQ
ncbi:amino acid transporter [Xylariaceae sp. FL1272]|nr:amino acid transporter [Xylariaceae sp. FL1272]